MMTTCALGPRRDRSRDCKLRRLVWPAVLAVAAGAGPAPGLAQVPVVGPASGGRAAREAILAADQNLAAAVRRDGLARALPSALGSDGLLLFEGASIVAGAEVAARLLQAPEGLARLRIDWLPLSVQVSPDGSLGFTYGVTLSADRGAADTAEWRASKYISVWRREGDGWRLAAHAQTRFLSAPPPPSTAVTTAASPWQRTDGAGARFAAADRAFARLAGDSGAPTAFTRYAAPTGVTFGPGGELLVGPEAIGARMRENPNRTEWQWAPRFAGASADGEMGFTVGEASIRATSPDGESSTFHSKYLTVWRRMPDGSIRFLVDGGNSRPARP